MGPKAEILLVMPPHFIFRAALALALALLCLVLLSCNNQPQYDRVRAEQYDAFWLWAGVEPQAVLDKASQIYILEGEVRASDPDRLISLRSGIPSVQHADIWMVVRVETLNWTPQLTREILARLEKWSQNSRVIGLQIDFDARTKLLNNYSHFLKELRGKLPVKYRLGITGLMDWSANGDPAALKSLSGTIDEIVIQTYQGRTTIKGYEAYFRRIDQIGMPYRIGLVQEGEWTPPDVLAKDPNFRGYVIFLINPSKNTKAIS